MGARTHLSACRPGLVPVAKLLADVSIHVELRVQLDAACPGVAVAVERLHGQQRALEVVPVAGPCDATQSFRVDYGLLGRQDSVAVADQIAVPDRSGVSRAPLGADVRV